MFFSIDPSGDVPIYEQIVRQVKLAVADGVLVGGQMVPSVRQLSKNLAINPNTGCIPSFCPPQRKCSINDDPNWIATTLFFVR